MNGSEFIKLLLWRGAGKKDKYLVALRATANYYGWTQEFEEWTPRSIGEAGNYTYCIDPGRKGNLIYASGMRLRICRSPKKQGMPAGLTNQFKVSRNCGLLDIAEIAHFTNVDWHWMDGPFGERIERARWERIYQAGIPGRRGVAVSA